MKRITRQTLIAADAKALAKKRAPVSQQPPATQRTIDYDAAVVEGKAIVAEMSCKQWALGDLADAVTKAYGENRLEQFAGDISFHGASCTLGRYRDVCRAFPKNRVRPRFFASAQILATHDDRFAIVERSPALSKAEAREFMRQAKAGDQPEEDEDTAPLAKPKEPKATPTEDQVRHKETKKWFADLVGLANTAVAETGEVMKYTPEQRDDLLKNVEPQLLREVRKGGEALLALADWLAKLFDEAADQLEQDGRVTATPKPAMAA